MSRSFKARFEDDGVVFLPGTVPRDLISDFTSTIDDIASQNRLRNPQNMRCRFAIVPDSGAAALDALDPITDISPAAASIAEHPGVHEILRELYDAQPVLFKDKYIMRQSGAPGYPPHQDYIAWPFFPKTFMTVLVAIDQISESNGALRFYKGSHKKGLLTPADGDFHNISRVMLAGSDVVTFTMQPGDVVIFNGFVVHESSTNSSATSRRSLYLSYNAEPDGGDQRAAHYRYFHSWLKRRFGEYGAERLFFE